MLSLPTPRLSFCLAAMLVVVIGCSDTNEDPAQPPELSGGAIGGPQSTGGMPTITPVSGTGPLVETTTDHFTFWAFGDNRSGPAVFAEIMTAAARDKPAFALSLGDIIVGKPDAPVQGPDPNGSELDAYLTLAAKGEVPIFNAPGNHEMIALVSYEGDDSPAECPNEKVQASYQDKIAPLFGAFTFRNSRFIVLNTDDTPVTCVADDCPICAPCLSGDAPGSSDVWECSFLGDTQLQRLKDDLANNASTEHIVILMHYPLKPHKSQDRLANPSFDALNGIITDHQNEYGNIKFVLASHEHEFYNPQDSDNFTTIDLDNADFPYYLVSGGAGAPMSHLNDPKHPGEFYHYLVFNVDGSDISVSIERLADPSAPK